MADAPLDALLEQVPDDDAAAVREAVAAFDRRDGVARLWKGDASLWTGADEADWLGWLRAPLAQQAELAGYRALAEEVRPDGFRHALLLGMGGSSLCCEVLAETLASGARRVPGAPELVVVDSTVPAQVRAVDARIDPARTLCIVSSKSGGTVETDVLRRHFFARVADAVGAERAPAHFVAITDPGSALEARAREERWRAIAKGVPEIGGRFSALSPFGLVPAALLGLDVDDLLARAQRTMEACGPEVPAERNPGVALGVLVATLARRGRDKLTVLASPGLASLGAWLEQLVAESTGKHGKGIVPVVDEVAPGDEAAARWGPDRLFVYARLADEPHPAQDAAVERLAAAGHPVVRLDVASREELAAEFWRWEMATAASGAELELNPFDQPDVESAKQAARRLVAAYEESGALPSAAPMLREAPFELHADEAHPPDLGTGDLASRVSGWLGALRPGDYLALNAFVERCEANARPLAALRAALRQASGNAVTLGWGPRFLHSTGQLHKGGPDSAVVLEITAHDAEDLPIPGQRIRFGTLKDAQARGDFAVLCERGRRALRIHLAEGDVAEGLETLRRTLTP